MQVDSYLELFTTFYGWAFANIIGEIITGTGLIVMPFAIVILLEWKEAKESGLQDIGILSVIESIQTKLVVMLIVMSLGFFTTPIATLSTSRIGYTPNQSIAEPTPTTVNPGASGTTFDTALADALNGTISPSGNLTYVPLWWYSIMSLSAGINNAVRAGLTNTSPDIRILEDMARNVTIEDPQLRHELQRFYSECFTPARSLYLASDRSTISGTGAAIIDPGNRVYGPTDVDWIGSKFFRDENGYYNTLRSRAPVPGFAIDLSRDTDYFDPASGIDPTVAGAVNPEFGRPTCKQWWETQLREKLVGHSSLIQQMLSGLQGNSIYPDPDVMKDEAAKLAATTANPVFIDSDKIMGNNYDTATTLGRAMTGAVSTFGVARDAGIASMSMLPLMTGLPMAQALILMALYALLPLVLFMSGFQLRVLLIGAAALFSIKLWASLWYIAQWVDAHLINAMYPGNLGNFIVQEVQQMAKGAVPPGYKRMVLNTLLMTMFIGFPLIWSSMMLWIGVNIGGGLATAISTAYGVGTAAGRPPSMPRGGGSKSKSGGGGGGGSKKG